LSSSEWDTSGSADQSSNDCVYVSVDDWPSLKWTFGISRGISGQSCALNSMKKFLLSLALFIPVSVFAAILGPIAGSAVYVEWSVEGAGPVNLSYFYSPDSETTPGDYISNVDTPGGPPYPVDTSSWSQPASVTGFIYPSGVPCTTDYATCEATALDSFVIWKADSTLYIVDPYGCTDPSAENYDPSAVYDNGTCVFPIDFLPEVGTMVVSSLGEMGPNILLIFGAFILIAGSIVLFRMGYKWFRKSIR